MRFARLEIEAALSWLRASASHDLPEERIEDGDKITIIRYVPLGVAVGIVPWNYPILLAVGKLAAAVLTGNTIIIKPSPFTPAGGLKLCELAQQYFPPGVVQCLSGDERLGIWLTSHPVPAKISFTGSTATGKKVMESASKTLKRVTLELGGKDPAIICEDVDIEDVASKVSDISKRVNSANANEDCYLFIPKFWSGNHPFLDSTGCYLMEARSVWPSRESSYTKKSLTNSARHLLKLLQV